MPHTSVERFRKCGEKPRPVDQTPVLGIRDLRFCCRKRSVLGGFRLSPHFRNYDSASRVLATMLASSTTSSSREYIKGPLPENRTTSLLCLAPRRVSGDCIAENNERVGTRVPLQILARAAYIHFRRVVFHVRQKAHAQPYSSSRFPNEQIAFSIPRRRLPNCLISR